MILRHINSVGELSIEKAASSIGIVGRQGAHPLSTYSGKMRFPRPIYINVTFSWLATFSQLNAKHSAG